MLVAHFQDRHSDTRSEKTLLLSAHLRGLFAQQRKPQTRDLASDREVQEVSPSWTLGNHELFLRDKPV